MYILLVCCTSFGVTSEQTVHSEEKELAVSEREQKFDFYYNEHHEHHHIVCMEIKENFIYLSMIISR